MPPPRPLPPLILRPAYLTYLSLHLFLLAFFGSVIASFARSLAPLDCLSKKHNSLFSRSLARAHMLARSLLRSLQSDRDDERTNGSLSPPLLLVRPSRERYKYFCGFSVSGALRGIGRRINIPSMVATSPSVLTLSLSLPSLYPSFLPSLPSFLFLPAGKSMPTAERGRRENCCCGGGNLIEGRSQFAAIMSSPQIDRGSERASGRVINVRLTILFRSLAHRGGQE